MPDQFDDAAQGVYDAALAYSRTTTNSRISKDEWVRVLTTSGAAARIRDAIDRMPATDAQAAYRNHQVRDAITKAVASVKRVGKQAVEEFFRAERREPGLWVLDTLPVLPGVFHVDAEDDGYDVPIRHLSLVLAANLLMASSKAKIDKWTPIGAHARAVIDMPDVDIAVTMSHPLAAEVFERLQRLS